MLVASLLLVSVAGSGASPAEMRWEATPKRKATAVAAKPRVIDLVCRGEMIVRSNDNRIADRTNQTFSVRINYTKKTANMYGIVPTLGGELVFPDVSPLTVDGDVLSFPSKPLGNNRVVTSLQIERNSGAFTFRNRHQWAAVFGAVPLFETLEMSGRCDVDRRTAPRIPG